MNPKTYQEDKAFNKRELMEMFETQAFQTVLNQPQNENLRKKVLSMISEEDA